METKSESISLHRCRCGSAHAIIAKIKPGLVVVACNACPTHARGSTEAEARKNWNLEVQR
jgi:hypothetical protein